MSSSSVCSSAAWSVRNCRSTSGPGACSGAGGVAARIHRGRPVAEKKLCHPPPLLDPPDLHLPPRPFPYPMPNVRFAMELIHPAVSYPAQKPAARPVRGPIPIGPLRSPPGIGTSSFLIGRVSLSGERRSALWTYLLNARHSLVMRFCVSACRANAHSPVTLGRESPFAAAAPAAPSPVRSGHRKISSLKRSVQPCRERGRQFTGNKRDDMDAVGV